MPRKILLPESLERKLASLTDYDEEISGVLLYRQLGDSCIVEGIFLTGGGEAGSVEPDPDRVEVVNEFLKANPEYRYVEFHTHSRGTIKAYGRQFAKSFSKGDIQAIQSQLARDKSYMHLLVTPESRLLYGADSPRLVSGRSPSGHGEREQTLYETLNAISGRLGYDVAA